MSSTARGHDERRNHYRVDVDLHVRLRPSGDGRAERRAGPDPVGAYEELSAAAARFRKDAEPAARAFVDKLMATLEAIVGAGEERSTGGGWRPRVLVTANLSAGGVGFVWDEPFELGRRLDLEFTLRDDAAALPFRVAAVVRRSSRAENGWHLGVEWDEIPQATQQRLIRTVFDLQRQALRQQVDRR